jgi:hypothetical protein
MTQLYCICADEACGHTPGEHCGKQIDEEHIHPAYADEGTIQEASFGICDDCWERIQRSRDH